ncbi:type III-A CRISPR-associated RAMP protein Csm5 [Fervidobacterium thailandense]|uniref:CRISPR system Cms protein Csm5 n=1 Tax=Fervidobacterium thailandense TaxID=1008305 RepID=A0A1E3G1C7_9BACT|nr:type III-A CRISPR-associated RAMP protein Csm5 [Fervidobacterium thailandense]ODN29663.1 hypothetical protein A4H02_09540 [Fervidobacterium thailandense]
MANTVKSFWKTYRYEIEIITPVHIGSGNKIKAFEFGYDKERLYVLNVEKIAEEFPELTDEIVQVLMEPDGSNNSNNLFALLKRKGVSNFQKFSKYAIKAYNFRNYNGLREFFEYIKTAGRPYIPGSSIKGCFMKELATFPAMQSRAIGILQSLSKIQDPKERSKKFEQESKRLLVDTFGDPRHSFGKLLRISDSTYLEVEALQLANVKILGINGSKNGPRQIAWFFGKRQGESIYKNEPDQTNGVFCEVLPQGLRLQGYASVLHIEPTNSETQQYPWMRKENHLNNLVSGNSVLLDILNFIRSNVSNYLQTEKGIFKSITPNQSPTNRMILYNYLQFLEKIDKLQQNLKPNEVLVRLGAHTGFITKSILGYPSQNLIPVLKNFLKGTVHVNEFPKTRKLILKDRNDVEQLGWVKITFYEEKDVLNVSWH